MRNERIDLFSELLKNGWIEVFDGFSLDLYAKSRNSKDEILYRLLSCMAGDFVVGREVCNYVFHLYGCA